MYILTKITNNSLNGMWVFTDIEVCRAEFNRLKEDLRLNYDTDLSVAEQGSNNSFEISDSKDIDTLNITRKTIQI